ncbi:MAG: autotransporter assembly complex protein TamA [Pseudomonadota bacterium]|nr:autotransporter assembly complex protein TamA [Pseudomonadota bacterium]
MPIASRTCLALLCLVFCSTAQAARVTDVDIRGIDDEDMAENIRVSLSLVDAIGRELSERRLAYLVGEAEDEAREALQPFGYYDPQITVEQTGRGDATAVTVTVDPGQPVRVRRSDIAIVGDGAADRYLQADLDAFEPEPGEVLDHAQYELSKRAISRRLTERGYFDADFNSRRVEVTRAERAADIELVWDSGQRYDIGNIDFRQEPRRIIREGLLEELVYWEEGSYYHQGKLDRLRDSLSGLDYFSSIDIRPQLDQASDGQVPVVVTLTPAKRSVYNAGISFGTDSGAGINLGLERRYLNQRGHKALAQLNLAERRSTLTLQYRIPAFAWLDGWYTFAAQAADEQTDYIDSRRIEFVASRSGQISDQWTAIASVHALRERWDYVEEDDQGQVIDPDYRYATFTYPSIRGEYVDIDDLAFPREGVAGTVLLRGGVEGAGSDADFLQTRLTARWYKGFGERDRLILRGEIGHTFTDEVVSLPPSLRFYAGGDRSIRGYEWREVGPRITAADGSQFALGAENVVTGGIEFEHYFNDTWGAAVFVDSGSAFNDDPDWRTGVGVGLRWRTPVGPLRVDIARGLDNPDSDFQLYLAIGAAL